MPPKSGKGKKPAKAKGSSKPANGSKKSNKPNKPNKPNNSSKPKKSDKPNNHSANSASGSGGGGPPRDNYINGTSICRAFQQGLCTRGSYCRYWHPAPNNEQTQPTYSISVPNNVCQEFWHSGTCSRGVQCRFEHRQDLKEGVPQPTIMLQEHFREAGLRNFPGITNRPAYRTNSATPAETYQQLRVYTQDSFRFQIPDQVYRFLELLCNASTQNTSWTAEDGQRSLHEIVEGNGIRRLDEVIRFLGNPETPWSFQRGYILVLTYLSSEWVVKSTLHSDVNALYGLVHNNMGIMCNAIETHMARMMVARSFKDGISPLSGNQVFRAIFVTMFEYLTRVKGAGIADPAVCQFVIKIANWFDEWVLSLTMIPPFDDECATENEHMKVFIVDNLSRDKDRVLRLVRREEPRVVRRSFDPRTRTSAAEGLIVHLQRICDYHGPGELRLVGPRHDNDYVNFEQIRIAPTYQHLFQLG